MSDNIIPIFDKNELSEEKKEVYAEIIRKMSEHENTLINMRFSWFTTIQGLLFAGLSFTWKDKNLLIVSIVSTIGILVGVSILFALKLGGQAQDELRKWWKQNLHTYAGPPRVGFDSKEKQLNNVKFIERIYPKVVRYLRPWRLLPFVFILAWTVILIIVLQNLSFRKNVIFKKIVEKFTSNKAFAASGADGKTLNNKSFFNFI